MSEIKLNLSIEIPGRTMFRENECLKKIERHLKRNGKTRLLIDTVYDSDKTEKNILVSDKGDVYTYHTRKCIPARQTVNISDVYTYHTRKCIPARQTVNISKEAYTYMVGNNSAPSHITHKAWIGMSKKERLQTHLKMIADDLGGTSYTYKVFED